jgi:hypothetical protein
MTASRMSYNEAVQQTERRELLLNLVRLRYAEQPEFLSISSISTQFGFSAGASLGAEIGFSGNHDSSLLIPGGSVGFSESPTITFIPRHDSEFTQQLVAPVELESIYLLVHYGWGIDKVFRVIVKGMNGLSNATEREGVTAAASGNQVDFVRVTRLLRRLERQGNLTVDRRFRRTHLSEPIPVADFSPGDLLDAAKEGFEYVYLDEPPSYVLTQDRQHFVLRIAKSVNRSDDFRTLANLTGLDPDSELHDIDPGISFPGEVGVPTYTPMKIDTRSVQGAMAYLSGGVEVPTSHIERSLASEAWESANAPHDIFAVSVSETEPKASLSVPYKGHWFYIDDSDLASKRILGLMHSLIRLEIGTGGSQNVPLLTLPVGR